MEGEGEGREEGGGGWGRGGVEVKGEEGEGGEGNRSYQVARLAPSSCSGRFTRRQRRMCSEIVPRIERRPSSHQLGVAAD